MEILCAISGPLSDAAQRFWKYGRIRAWDVSQPMKKRRASVTNEVKLFLCQNDVPQCYQSRYPPAPF